MQTVSLEIKKNIVNLPSAELAQRVLIGFDISGDSLHEMSKPIFRENIRKILSVCCLPRKSVNRLMTG